MLSHALDNLFTPSVISALRWINCDQLAILDPRERSNDTSNPRDSRSPRINLLFAFTCLDTTRPVDSRSAIAKTEKRRPRSGKGVARARARAIEAEEAEEKARSHRGVDALKLRSYSLPWSLVPFSHRASVSANCIPLGTLGREQDREKEKSSRSGRERER